MWIFGAEYSEKCKTLYGKHKSGFYSCINTVRASLYKLISDNIFPEKIDLSQTLDWYKDNPNRDYYSLLYQTDLKRLSDITDFKCDIFCPTGIKYDYFDFKNTSIIEECYFSPSEIVNNNFQTLIEKYQIDFSNTLAVLHRGNDKWKESKLVQLNDWILEIENFYNGERILIQTDEENFKNGFLDHFKDKCFVFDEMLFNNSYVLPHNNKQNWAVNFESVMRIISKCQKIITHSGNCGFVPIIYRGNVNGVIHLLNNGVFIKY